MKQKLLVLHELETMFPPLSKDEYEGLKADIAQKGILSPVVVWNSTIVDGHHRVKAARELDIDVPTVELEFDSIDEARLWALQHQKNRRNLPAYLFGEIALQMKPELEVRAKKRMLAGVKTAPVPTLAPGSGKVRDELASIAQVSHGTMSKIEYLAEHADEETKDKLRRGEKGVSISGVYNDLKTQETKDKSVKDKQKTEGEPTAEDAPSVQIEEKTPIEAPKAEEPVPVDNEPTVQEKTVNPYAERIKEIVYGDVEKYHYDCVNLMNIPKYQTVQLRNCLFKLFTTDYRVDLIVALMEEMVEVDGKEVVSNLMKTLKKKFK